MADLATLAARIDDGCHLALAPDYSGCSFAMVRTLIAKGVKKLHLTGVPQLGFQADFLIGAGLVEVVESAAVTLGEFGAAPCFTRAIKNGHISIRDSTCPAIHAGLQAAEKGIPFMPLRGVLGSDLINHRPDWKVVPNPFNTEQKRGDDPILLVPMIRPDVALFHAAKADHFGNVWIGVRRELMLMAHAARTTLVTVEEIVSCNLLHDEGFAAGTIPALYVDAIAEAPLGAKPLGLRGCYRADADQLLDYARLARTADGFQQFLERFLDSEPRMALA